jgi:hypothetical protein
VCPAERDATGATAAGGSPRAGAPSETSDRECFLEASQVEPLTLRCNPSDCAEGVFYAFVFGVVEVDAYQAHRVHAAGGPLADTSFRELCFATPLAIAVGLVLRAADLDEWGADGPRPVRNPQRAGFGLDVTGADRS